MKKLIVTLMILVAAICAGCGKDEPKQVSQQANQQISQQAEKKAVEVKKISQEEAMQMMQSETDYVILDVRTEPEYEKKHIANAKVFPVGELRNGVMPTELVRDKNQIVFVYCWAGRRAEEASNILAKDIGEIVPLNYDQVQVFGLEAAFVLWKLNTRWEAAYNLTEDIAGDNPWIKNNSVAWVAGFDIDLPIHNLNLNVQETGSYILHNDKVKDMDRGITIGGNTVSWKTIGTNYDVDYNSDDKYTRNKLIVLLSDKWLNEKLTTEVQGIWGIEFKEFMVAPKIEYNISEGLTFGLRGVYLYSNNENGEFYNFTKDSLHHDKAFVELTAKYQF